MAPCIEVVGYRQRKKGITSFGDLCSDFGANVKFLIGRKKRYRKINIGNLKTNINNKKIKQSVNGNTNTVYINPLNSLSFVLKELKKSDGVITALIDPKIPKELRSIIPSLRSD